MAGSNRPLFILWIKPKSGVGSWTKAGAVFDNQFDMGLVINPGVVLTSELMEKNWLVFAPFDKEAYGNQTKKDQPSKDVEDLSQDDLPF